MAMKMGRISKGEEKFIRENLNLGFEELATELDREPESILTFIKKKVAKGDFDSPIWMAEPEF